MGLLFIAVNAIGAKVQMPDQGQQLMGVATRLAASLEGLAALAAFVRVETEGLDVDPRIRGVLSRIATELVGS